MQIPQKLSKGSLGTVFPGLVFVILPIILVSEGLYWIESLYVSAVFHLPAPVISLMIAAVLAIIVTNVVRLPAKYSGGLEFSTKWLLKAGIILYGLNFSYALWLKSGANWIIVIGFATVTLPMIVAYFAGKFVFRLDEHSSMLVAVGTGVCGISAIVATREAIEADEKSAGLALATILVFGTFVLFLYPLLQGFLALNQTVYGIWTGATTLDLPQLVAAALQGGGNASLAAALWVKSIRIGLLVPVIFLLSIQFAKNSRMETSGRRTKLIKITRRALPLFIIFFFLAILLNTIYAIPSWILAPVATGRSEFLNLNLASIFLTAAIIGICFRVRKEIVGRAGWKILGIGGIAWGVQSLVVFWLASYLPIPHI